jgi:hypothetical protein
VQERGDAHDPVPDGEPGSGGDRDDVSGNLLAEPDRRLIQQREVASRHKEVRQPRPCRAHPHQRLAVRRVRPANLLKLYDVHGITEANNLPGTALDHKIPPSIAAARRTPPGSASAIADTVRDECHARHGGMQQVLDNPEEIIWALRAAAWGAQVSRRQSWLRPHHENR